MLDSGGVRNRVLPAAGVRGSWCLTEDRLVFSVVLAPENAKRSSVPGPAPANREALRNCVKCPRYALFCGEHVSAARSCRPAR